MTDKEKIRAYIEKLHIEHRGSEGDSIFRRALRTVLFYIDSMQEEPKKCMYSKDNYTDEDRKVLCDGCEEDCKYSKKETVSDGCIYNRTLEERQHSCKYCSAACQARIEELSIADIVDEHFDEMLGEEPVSEDLEEAVNAYIGYAPEVDESSSVYGKRLAFKAGAKWQKEQQEEPVSDDLGEYINELSKQFPEVSFAKLSRIAVRVAKWQKEQEYTCYEEAFEDGAKWKKEQFEKNRLKHCNSITNEQAELEQGFIDQHLDKYQRMPTFLDAIEYGMKLQKEQMMKDATEVTVHMEAGNYPYIPQLELYDYDKDIPLAKEGDRYKVVLIKED